MYRLFEMYPQGQDIKLLAKDLPLLKDVGPQKIVVFSADGSRFAAAGEVIRTCATMFYHYYHSKKKCFTIIILLLLTFRNRLSILTLSLLRV